MLLIADGVLPGITRPHTTLTMDFDAQQSISETGSHNYMFKPVIKITQA